MLFSVEATFSLRHYQRVLAFITVAGLFIEATPLKIFLYRVRIPFFNFFVVFENLNFIIQLISTFHLNLGLVA